MSQPSLSIEYGTPLEEEEGMGPLTIGGYLRELTRRHGPAEALVMGLGEHRVAWSYDELLARSVEVSKALIGSGLGKDARVGILMTNRPEFLSSLFGAALAGAVPVVLSTFSTPSELDYLVKASQVSVLLVEQHVLKKDFVGMIAEAEPAVLSAGQGALASERYPFLQRLVSLGGVAGGGDPLVSLERGAVERWATFLARGGALSDTQVFARADSVVPTDTGGIFFSSGTTSLPKGIVHSQRAFAIQWWRWPRVFGVRDRIKSWTCNGFFWSGNVSMVAGFALSNGGTVVLQRYFDAEEALSLFEQERVNFINGRPHQWVRLTTAANWAGTDLASVKYVPRGEMIWEHPTVSTDWEIPMSFGTTETMTICTSRSEETAAERAENKPGDSGKPLPGNVLKIIDPFTGAILPRGTIGEMCIKGPTLMSGYLGKAPELCFDAEGFYRTGDGGSLDEAGRFIWDGRLTDMIKTGGANVAPMEVDEVIAKFPGVKRSQTVGVPDDLLGERVVACIVPVEGVTLDPAAITDFVKREIASFKVPRQILFFTDEDYALTGNEKIKASAQRELAMKRLGIENAAAA